MSEEEEVKLAPDNWYKWAYAKGLLNDGDINYVTMYKTEEPFTIFGGWGDVGYLTMAIIEEVCPEAIELYRKAGAIKERYGKEGIEDCRLGRTGNKTSNDDSPYLAPEMVKNALEASGFEWKYSVLETVIGESGFSDEYGTCDSCCCGIRISPDSYGWRPEYYSSEYGVICLKCFKDDGYAEGYINEMVNNPKNAVNLNLVDEQQLDEMGFFKINLYSYENGWHHGQNDDPKSIFKHFSGKYPEIIFTIDSVGQFDMRFSAWARGIEPTQAIEFSIRRGADRDEIIGELVDNIKPEIMEDDGDIVLIRSPINLTSLPDSLFRRVYDKYTKDIEEGDAEPNIAVYESMTLTIDLEEDIAVVRSKGYTTWLVDDDDDAVYWNNASEEPLEVMTAAFEILKAKGYDPRWLNQGVEVCPD